MKKCNCEDWEPNIEIINGMINTQAAHSWGNKDGYEGKPFDFCPWCGERLVDDDGRPKIKVKPIERGRCI